MEKQALFTIPMYHLDYPDHKDTKLLYTTFIDEYIDNKPKLLDFNSMSKATKKNLHSVSVFDQLINFISNLCPTLHSDFYISNDKTIAINSMWGSRCAKFESVHDQYFTDSFLYGVYFLHTPEGSGNMHVNFDITDRNYYDSIGPDDVNLINTNKFQCYTPEGKIILIPSHLSSSYTQNLKDDNRYMIHFTLKVIY